MISIDDALACIKSNVTPRPKRTQSIASAVGCRLAEKVVADVDSPPHDKSVMDGFAVRAADVMRGAKFDVLETIIAGNTPSKVVTTGTVSQIMTGAPMPRGADAVVMIERARVNEANGQRKVVFDLDSIQPGKHTMSRAASFAAGDEIFPAGHVVRPLDVGLLAEVGAAEVQVYSPPTASVIPTGNELVEAALKPGPGQIRNSNGPMLVEMLRAMNVDVDYPGIARDDEADLRGKIEQGLENDLLILSGGVSAGTMDLVPRILQECGVREIFHKVKVKPGKPIWFGIRELDDRKNYVFGLPGNPVSSLVGFHLFVRAALARMTGVEDIHPATVLAKLSEPHVARGDRPTWWPGCWVESNSSERIVQPLDWQGSSDLRALGRANVLVFFPTDQGQFEAGQQVAVSPLLS